MKINKLKDILLKVVIYIAGKLGYSLLPTKEVEYHSQIIAKKKAEKGLTAEQRKYKRIGELMHRIMENKFTIEPDLGEPTKAESSEEVIKINTIMQKVESGDYEEGYIQKVLGHIDQQKNAKMGGKFEPNPFDVSKFETSNFDADMFRKYVQYLLNNDEGVDLTYDEFADDFKQKESVEDEK